MVILQEQCFDAKFDMSINLLCENGLVNLLEDWFFEEIQRDLRQRVAYQFWQYFQSLGCDLSTENDTEKNVDCFLQAIDYLHKIAQDYQPCIQAIERIPREINR